jgi:hypothetical protein
LPSSQQPPDRTPDDYTFGPDSIVREGVSQGTWDKITWKSQICPDTERFVWTYVPAQYDPKPPAALMVFQVGVWQYAERDDNRPAARKAEYRVPTVLDDLTIIEIRAVIWLEDSQSVGSSRSFTQLLTINWH